MLLLHFCVLYAFVAPLSVPDKNIRVLDSQVKLEGPRVLLKEILCRLLQTVIGKKYNRMTHRLQRNGANIVCFGVKVLPVFHLFSVRSFCFFPNLVVLLDYRPFESLAARQHHWVFHQISFDWAQEMLGHAKVLLVKLSSSFANSP